MRRLLLAVPSLALVALLALSGGLWFWPGASPARPAPGELGSAGRPPATLPITQLSLFSSGVAFVQRQGEVEGNERVVLSLQAKDINDILKSLEVEDSSGGTVRTVSFASDEPPDRAARGSTAPKDVTLICTGKGKRTVRARYVVEHPLWKTTYRLTLNKDEKPRFRGWAVVENPTGEDWNDIRLSLVAARPLSFRVNLDAALYVRRPLLEPERFAALRPARSGGAVEPAPEPPGPPAPISGMKGGRSERAGSPGRHFRGPAGGEFFVYRLDAPVSLPRQQSALLPILAGEVGATRVSIYNEGVQPRYPVLGVRFRNTTKQNLSQGPLTVYEDNSYGGDAQLPDMQPGDERLLSYAIDLATEVAPSPTSSRQRVTNVKIIRGVLQATSKVQETKVYNVRSRAPQELLLLIEHPTRPEFRLADTPWPVEMTRNFYRFECKVEPDRRVAFTVTEERMVVQMVAMSSAEEGVLRSYRSQPVLSEKVKAALEKAPAWKGRLNEARAEVQRAEAEVKARLEDQARARADLERLHKEQDAYKRQLRKLDEMEAEIEKLQAGVRERKEAEGKQRKQYEEFLAGLSVE